MGQKFEQDKLLVGVFGEKSVSAEVKRSGGIDGGRSGLGCSSVLSRQDPDVGQDYGAMS